MQISTVRRRDAEHRTVWVKGETLKRKTLESDPFTFRTGVDWDEWQTVAVTPVSVRSTVEKWRRYKIRVSLVDNIRMITILEQET